PLPFSTYVVPPRLVIPAEPDAMVLCASASLLSRCRPPAGDVACSCVNRLVFFRHPSTSSAAQRKYSSLPCTGRPIASKERRPGPFFGFHLPFLRPGRKAV